MLHLTAKHVIAYFTSHRLYISSAYFHNAHNLLTSVSNHLNGGLKLLLIRVGGPQAWGPPFASRPGPPRKRALGWRRSAPSQRPGPPADSALPPLHSPRLPDTAVPGPQSTSRAGIRGEGGRNSGSRGLRRSTANVLGRCQNPGLPLGAAFGDEGGPGVGRQCPERGGVRRRGEEGAGRPDTLRGRRRPGGRHRPPRHCCGMAHAQRAARAQGLGKGSATVGRGVRWAALRPGAPGSRRVSPHCRDGTGCDWEGWRRAAEDDHRPGRDDPGSGRWAAAGVLRSRT